MVLVTIQGGLYGRIVARWGVGATFRTGLLIVALGLAVLAFSTTWPVLIVALVLLAVGQGCASPSITEIVSEVAPASTRGAALGFQQSAYAVARVVGPPDRRIVVRSCGCAQPVCRRRTAVRGGRGAGDLVAPASGGAGRRGPLTGTMVRSCLS